MHIDDHTYIVVQVFDDGSAFVAQTRNPSASVAQVVEQAYTGQGLWEALQEPTSPTETEPAAPVCQVHNVPMALMEGKKGPFWSCHEKTDGEWCKYRPPKSTA